MKITKQRLKEIIKEEFSEAYSREEVGKIINVPKPPSPPSPDGPDGPSLKVTEILQNIMQIEADLSKFRKKLENQIRTSARRNIDQHPEPGAGVPSLRHSDELKEVKKSFGALLESIKI